MRIVWLQSPPWDGVWTRQNHFARRFARDGAEILYVENPQAIGARLKQSGLRGLIDGLASVREVEPGLKVMTLPVQLPGGRGSEAIGRLNGRRFARAIQAHLSREGWTDYHAWCRLPGSIHALRHLQPRGVVYDVTDDYELYAQSPREARLTVAAEAAMCARANQVFTTTLQLQQKLSPMNAQVRIVPNGVDSVFFEQPESEEDPLPSVPRPRIGFIGLVARWMDFELLRKLGARWPGQVVIVGPVKAEVAAQLAAIPGLVCTGHVPHLDVPRYLRAFDVCILPNELTELRHRADPLKLVEYLASGKPTVSVALRSAEPLRPLVDVAASHDDFLALVEARLADPQPELAERRRATAAARSWDGLYAQVREDLLAL